MWTHSAASEPSARYSGAVTSPLPDESRRSTRADSPRIVIVMPAYNAAQTLERTYHDIPHDIVHHVILVDDVSRDETVEIARRLGLEVIVHRQNLGYGGNQKTCYTEALRRGGEIVVMVHPDYQYSPRLIVAMASMIASGHYDVALGSRIICRPDCRAP